MSGHTLKQWRINPKARLSIIDGNGRGIAACNYGDANDPYKADAENEANARLISTAPEMLAALKACHRRMVDSGDHGDEVEDALAAIQKAEATDGDINS